MQHVIALQSLDLPGQEANEGTDMEAISELSFAVCGPFPSDISSFGCI